MVSLSKLTTLIPGSSNIGFKNSPWAKNFLSFLALGSSFFLFGCATQNVHHQEDDWLGKDKYAHFLVSTAVSAGIAKAAKDDGMDKCDAAMVGFSVTLTLGAAKESYDKRKKKTLYSYRDMAWNTAGSVLGSLLGSGCHR